MPLSGFGDEGSGNGVALRAYDPVPETARTFSAAMLGHSASDAAGLTTLMPKALSSMRRQSLSASSARLVAWYWAPPRPW